MLTLTLPYPPTVNTYWRMGRGRIHISAKGRAYREDVKGAVMIGLVTSKEAVDFRLGNLSARIDVYPPDRRRRDLDNVLKAIFDSLGGGHAGVFEDDNQIKEIHATMHDYDKLQPAEVQVRITKR